MGRTNLTNVARARYDRIGVGYAKTRREDPTLRYLIHEALGESKTILNVGAGAGSYEPSDRIVVAVEPSREMLNQRLPEAAPAVQCSCYPLPFRDDQFDSSMAVLTVHHWDQDKEAGVRELRRVTKGRIAIVTYDTEVESTMWLVRDYLPEVGVLDSSTFPSLAELSSWLGGKVDIITVPVPRDTPDWSFGSFWAHPERILSREARAAVSALVRLPAEVVQRAVDQLQNDLESGEWDRKFGHLRSCESFDVGMRLVIASP